uniref:Uncharacterized protein n=1 Tax=Sphaeramia orbicularis TaxID=375764 RepID=A0A672YNM9_9TELE
MPSSNTGHLPQTLVSLPGELLRVTFPTFKPMALCDTDDVNHLVLVEDSRDGHSFLQTLFCPLHLRNMGLFLLYWEQSKILVELFLSCLILPLLSVLSEGLLLTFIPKTQKLVPVFVKSALALITDMFSKDGLERTKATDCVNVSYNPNHNDRWILLCIHDTQCPFVHTEACTVHLPEGVSHAGLVSQKGGEVDRLAGVIFGPGTNLAPMFLATFVGQEPHVSMAWSLTMTAHCPGEG